MAFRFFVKNKSIDFLHLISLTNEKLWFWFEYMQGETTN